MRIKHLSLSAAWGVAVLLLFQGAPQAAAAEPRGLGDPGQLQAIVLETGRERDGGFDLMGRDSWQQLLVTGKYATGQVRDLTRQAAYQIEPAGIVHVDATGLVTPLQEGKATLTARVGGQTTTTQVTVSHMVHDLPVNFPNQVVPIFTKFGCNAGGCHGKADGQNGFKLSLLGFEPEEDYEYVVKEGRGRRLFPAAPSYSLLLMKAVGTSAHGGGKRLEQDSPYYRLLVRWIEQGSPYGQPDDPVVTGIEVFPKHRLMDRASTQQLAVVAHFSDGTRRDVTRMTQFEANVPDMAEVSEYGLVRTKQLAGNVAIMTRFQSFVDVFRVTVPLGAPVENLPPAQNFIDELVFQQLRELGLPPSELCDDATFIRRATLDIAGRLPTAEETVQFLADKDAQKHEKLIDRLLDSPDYAYYFGNKWSAVLRNRRNAPTDDPKPTAAFHAWIVENLRTNRPYDAFVRDVLTATGEEIKNPPAVWYREVKETADQLEDTAQLFLGQRIQCARCHHHPFEKWSQQDYYGMAAFFSRLEVKDPPAPRRQGNQPPPPKPPLTVAHKPGAPQAVNPKTNQPVPPTGLGGQPLQIAPTDDPRHQLVDWMTQKDNPFFAKSLVNRYWKHFFSRGLVDPEDDLRITNPPSNPALLDALAKHFVDHDYDMKNLIRVICTSHVYRLSAVPNAYNADDQQNYSRYIPKRLNAEVLLDAIDDVTLTRSTFRNMPAGTRAVQLPDNMFDSYFLGVFGRPDSASACECERSADANLAQSLHLLNSTEILGKVSGARAQALAKDTRPHEERIRDLYLVALSRRPTAEEVVVMVGYIEKKGDVKTAYEDILWALINTKEFLFNH
ncbi:MAG: DUF1549 and DUF1553 domain-containing protein [Gemmataceae bacterium]